MNTQQNNIPMNETCQLFADTLDEIFQQEGGLAPDRYDELESFTATPEKIMNCIPAFKMLAEEFKESIGNCNNQIKTWQDYKRTWQLREEQLLKYSEELLRRSNMKSLKSSEGSITQTSRKVLEINEDALLRPYAELYNAFVGSLPEFVKVSMGIDRIKLANLVKDDNTLLVSQPQDCHWKEQITTKIK